MIISSFLTLLSFCFASLESSEGCVSGFKIEICTQDHDLEKVAEVVNAAFEKNSFLVGNRISVEELNALLSNPDARLYLYLSPENRICGTALMVHRLDEASFGLFAIHPDYQGKKLGSVLLQHAENKVVEEFNVKRITLNTTEKKLVDYYQNQGYRVTGEFSFPEESFIKPEFRGKKGFGMTKTL